MATKKHIWVIEHGSYSDYRVLGVYSTLEAAKLAASKIDDATVDKWILDPALEEINQGYNKYSVLMHKNGDVDKVEEMDYIYDLSPYYTLWKRSTAPYYLEEAKRTKKPVADDLLRAEVWAENEVHAVKIVNEHRSQMIAEGKWK
jgi:exosome complex RNA-binding protein Rrp42 (RNase PH superfamily)